MEFQVGDKVMLKVSPWKGVVRFGKRGKLNPRYVGSFKALERVGDVAYKLDLPKELSRVHNTFHVSNLKKCHADEPLAVPLDGLHFDDKLHFVEEPVEIVDREVKRLKQSRITLVKAWERFKEMLRACPHHGLTELAQIDTFYNGLNDNDQDSLNATAGGNLLSKTTREALQIIKNKSKVRYSRNKSNVSRMNKTFRENASKSDDRIDKLADQILTLVDIFAKKVVTPAPVKAVEESCVTCGGAHAY
nr:putative reverse transcriptase domain-containing protein [Tanacetum cinerariifolium]